jgi:hypothetical protein
VLIEISPFYALHKKGIKIKVIKPDDVETTSLPMFLLFRKEEE